jgi:hypothetical protein
MRWLMSLVLIPLIVCCSNIDRETASRRSVKRLLAAPDKHLTQEMNRVVAFGEFVLVDIEQELHSAEVKGRLRLLEALRRIDSHRALPLVQFIARWDNEQQVRTKAKLVSSVLQGSISR